MPQRRRYTKQFKEEAPRLVSQEGVSFTGGPGFGQKRRDGATLRYINETLST